MKILFSPEDLSRFEYERDLGEPGAFPFTRGVYPSMYTGRLWTMRQYAGYATAAESNRRYKYLLEHGQTGLSVAFDLPALYGYDADHPMAAGEVGKCGVAVSSLADLEILFEGIPLDHVSTSMTITSTAATTPCACDPPARRASLLGVNTVPGDASTLHRRVHCR